MSIGQPHDVVEAVAVPHPGGVTFEAEGETDNVPLGMDNLAARAAEDVMLRAGRSGHGVRLLLRKRIPAGAGLGGGSADAAAALVAVRRLLELALDDDELLDASRRARLRRAVLPAAAAPRGCAVAASASSRSMLPSGLPFLVAIPPFRLATPAVYADVGRARRARGDTRRCARPDRSSGCSRS